MSSRSQRADEVLDSLSRAHSRRSTPACYPCYKRKVRCEGGRPCQACVARGHSDICHDDGQPRKRPKREQQQARGPSPRDVLHEELEDARSLLGDHPTLDNELADAASHSNNSATGPRSLPKSSSTSSNALPRQSEIMRFFPPFRDIVMRLYAIVTDLTALETVLYTLVATSNAVHRGENMQPEGVTSAQVAVILACLALGCQFAELDAATRQDTSQDLINRSNTCLQEGNFTLNPSIEVVQALLLIGLAQQNLEQSDAAWMLLGLTHRLAQTLGLNRPLATNSNPSATHQSHHLWQAILWQDTLLSLRYNRQLLSYDAEPSLNADMRPARRDLSYIEAMNDLCSITRDLLSKSAAQLNEIQRRMQLLRKAEGVKARCCDHLSARGQTCTFQQRTERKLLELHVNFVCAEICRPSFTADPNDQSQHNLRQQGVYYLQQCLEACLDLCLFSRFPLRSWSVTQAAISSAFLLANFVPTLGGPDTVQLLRKVSDTLWTDTSPPLAHKEERKPCVGLSVTRMKASKLLLRTVEENIRAGAAVTSHLAKQSGNAQPTEIRDFSTASLDWNGGPSEHSLFDPTFAAGVLNFDMDPAWFYDVS